MTTNFGHLKPWNRIYEYAIDMEEQILEASTVIKYKNAIGAARKVLECMLGEMTKAAGVTDGIIKETLRANGKNADYVSNYGRILALKSIGLLSPESVKNLLTLNSDGNAGNHPNSELDKLSLSEIEITAERVYRTTYRETYLFVHQYMPAIEAQKRKNSKAPMTKTSGTTRTVRRSVTNPAEIKKAFIVTGVVFLGTVGLLIALLKFVF